MKDFISRTNLRSRMGGWWVELQNLRLKCMGWLTLIGLAGFFFVGLMQTGTSVQQQSRQSYLANGEKSHPRIAVCLVGGARKFELTGPSLLKYVLNMYNNTDVFLYAPFDKDSHKFHFLKNVNSLAAIRIFSPQRLDETTMHAEALDPRGSPNGLQLPNSLWSLWHNARSGTYSKSCDEVFNKMIQSGTSFEDFYNAACEQGLLQYFNLVEGCLTMIKFYQIRYKVKYDWIVRTRVDGYWNGPLPPPQSYLNEKYIVPIGSQYGGLNDRLGIGNMETSEAALSRMSLIPLLHSSGYRTQNSETAFKHQLDVKGVKYEVMTFPFCIVTERKFVWPISGWDLPLASLSTRGQLNGLYCRPCIPASKGTEAIDMIQSLERGWGWTLAPQGLELCNAGYDWEEKWEDIFDKAAGPNLAAARKKIKNQTLSSCIKDFEAMKQKTAYWDAPSSKTLCKKAYGQSQ